MTEQASHYVLPSEKEGFVLIDERVFCSMVCAFTLANAQLSKSTEVNETQSAHIITELGQEMADGMSDSEIDTWISMVMIGKIIDMYVVALPPDESA